MYIRCAQCEQATWIKLRDGESPTSIACDSCGRSYPVRLHEQLGRNSREQYRSAVEFAESNSVDLPSAYSVLLEILTLDQARGAQFRSRKKKPRPTPPAKPSDTIREAVDHPYDPGFHAAVKDGTLTIQQALERGDRQIMAQRLAKRHRLPLSVALLVADNRVKLDSAIRGIEQEQAGLRPSAPQSLSPGQQALAVGFVATIFIAVVLYGAHLWEDEIDAAQEVDAVMQPVETEPTSLVPETPTERALRTTAVERDPEGRVVRIAGPNPISVLLAYCMADETSPLEPLELTSALPPRPGNRLGMFRNSSDVTETYAIAIRRDHLSHGWVVGDGRGPIEPGPAPALPPEAQRYPIEPD